MSTELNFLQRITVDKLQCPLYDATDPAKCYFDIGRVVIWDGNKENTGCFPAALEKRAIFDVDISDNIKYEIKKSHSRPSHLTANFNNQTVINSGPTHDLLGSLKSLSMQYFQQHGRPRSLPWAFWGYFTWSLAIGVDIRQAQYHCYTKVEIYVLPLNLHPLLDRPGIPLQLLRLPRFLPKWMSTSGKAPTGGNLNWPAFVISTLCSDSEREYETWAGSSKYTSWPLMQPGHSIREIFTHNLDIEFRLDLWLSDITDPNKVAVKDPVNCCDLAAICQILLYLGVENDSTTIRMKYLEPFGFIKPTQLLGKEERPPSRILCDKTSENRSAFGNHLFLTITKNVHDTEQISVLDPCCGPQTGTTLLKDYLAEAIDSDPGLYGRLNVHGQPTPPYRPGGLSDIVDGVGVSSIVTSLGLTRRSKAGDKSMTLLDRLASEIRGSWRQLGVTTQGGNRTISVVLEYQTPANSSVYNFATINLFRYSSEPCVSDAFYRQYSALRGYTEVQKDREGYSDDRKGSIRIFCNPRLKYMATLESRDHKAQETANLANRFHEVLDDNLSVRLTADYIQSALVNVQMPLSVGFRFPVKLLVSLPGTLQSFFSFQIHLRSTVNASWPSLLARLECRCDSRGRSPNGYRFISTYHEQNITFLGVVEIESPDSVEVWLLARSKGFDSVVITVYGGNLEVQPIMLNFWIA